MWRKRLVITWNGKTAYFRGNLSGEIWSNRAKNESQRTQPFKGLQIQGLFLSAFGSAHLTIERRGRQRHDGKYQKMVSTQRKARGQGEDQAEQ